ncbi:MAG: TonB-dependent receptor [Parasphingopyxis sp.]|uniref:TonB-dependent receptor n=1 Tax=Parasphingopyxis sp. TaxID=1920299 RepID=UPI003FA1308C
MKKIELLIATALGAGIVTPAMAQADDDSALQGLSSANAPIIVTAQRQAQTLQEVPIAVSAFDSEALESQQIENVSDLQLSLPNITFSKGNFTGSSLAIRGVGNLCVGFSCDSALGIHINGMPVLATRLFETEYFDLERIEVLRGPQGTLYGRNATSGVLNTITARPDLSGFSARAELEYGNFDAFRGEGMVNVPLADWAGLRVAGTYVRRDGYTTNLFDGSDIDGRELYAIRGSLRIEPTPDTTIDIIGYYFEENDNRSRIQKQLCDRDPTGVLGCLPTSLQNEPVNANATLASIFASAELLGISSGSPLFAATGLTSLYGPDLYSGVTVPSDVRTVNIDFNPTYFADEWYVMAQIDHDFGPVALQLTGGWQETSIDTRTDYNLTAAPAFGVQQRTAFATLAGIAADPAIGRFFAPAVNALFPNGPAGVACTSEANLSYAGVFGGDAFGCANQSIEFDRSTSDARQWSIEAILTSDFDGPFNFLLGGIYFDHRNRGGDYFVNAFGLDYAGGVLGGLQSLGIATAAADAAAAAVLAGGGSLADAQAAAGAAFAASPTLYLGPTFFNSETSGFTLESYGIFGEVYLDITDNLRLTVGGRYSNDEKSVSARSPLLATLVPFGTTDVASVISNQVDADPTTAGLQPFRVESASFDEITGRIVLDWQWSPDNLLYASYSRGYKSGGINPPVNPVEFPSVESTFDPEIINAFEIGSKNTLANGAVQLNGAIFYYDYQDLQLSRILARTSINTNTSAEVWGVELEAVVSPDPAWLFNFTASYLNTSIGDLQLIDSRDPSGGRSDTVILKSLDNASNCAVIPQAAGNAAGANAFVNTINGALGLQPTVPVPGTNTTGAFAFCSALQAAAAGNIGLFNPALAALQPLLNSFGAFTVAEGAEVDVTGNELPQAPNWKFSIGGQYTHEFDNGMNVVLRADYAFTGDQWSRSFNSPIDNIPSYDIANAQIQLNGADDRWFVRAFVQNIFDNDAITGQYVTDPSSGLFTNIFTLEPRRYGLAAGIRF